MSGHPAGGSPAGSSIIDALASPAPSIAGPLGDIGPPPQASFNELVPPEQPQQPLAGYPSFRSSPFVSSLGEGQQSLAGYPSFFPTPYPQPDPRRRFQFF